MIFTTKGTNNTKRALLDHGFSGSLSNCRLWRQLLNNSEKEKAVRRHSVVETPFSFFFFRMFRRQRSRKPIPEIDIPLSLHFLIPFLTLSALSVCSALKSFVFFVSFVVWLRPASGRFASFAPLRETHSWRILCKAAAICFCSESVIVRSSK